jgi:hypothetical protein
VYTKNRANSCRTEAVGTYVYQENEDEAFTDLLKFNIRPFRTGNVEYIINGLGILLRKNYV